MSENSPRINNAEGQLDMLKQMHGGSKGKTQMEMDSDRCGSIKEYERKC